MSIVERIIAELGPWTWHVVGLFLLGLEILAPGSFFLWFGISALIVGTLAVFFDWAWQIDALLFLGIAIVSLVIGRHYMKKAASTGGDPNLNERGSRYVGREFELSEGIEQGRGKINVDDTVWRVSGPDLATGSRVRVVEVDGANLKVEPVDKGA